MFVLFVKRAFTDQSQDPYAFYASQNGSNYPPPTDLLIDRLNSTAMKGFPSNDDGQSRKRVPSYMLPTSTSFKRDKKREIKSSRSTTAQIGASNNDADLAHPDSNGHNTRLSYSGTNKKFGHTSHSHTPNTKATGTATATSGKKTSSGSGFQRNATSLSAANGHSSSAGAGTGVGAHDNSYYADPGVSSQPRRRPEQHVVPNKTHNRLVNHHHHHHRGSSSNGNNAHNSRLPVTYYDASAARHGDSSYYNDRDDGVLSDITYHVDSAAAFQRVK